MYRVSGGGWSVIVVSMLECVGEVGVVVGGEQFLLDAAVNGVAGVCVDDGVIESGVKMCVGVCELKLDQFWTGVLDM